MIRKSLQSPWFDLWVACCDLMLAAHFYNKSDWSLKGLGWTAIILMFMGLATVALHKAIKKLHTVNVYVNGERAVYDENWEVKS